MRLPENCEEELFTAVRENSPKIMENFIEMRGLEEQIRTYAVELASLPSGKIYPFEHWDELRALMDIYIGRWQADLAAMETFLEIYGNREILDGVEKRLHD